MSFIKVFVVPAGRLVSVDQRLWWVPPQDPPHQPRRHLCHFMHQFNKHQESLQEELFSKKGDKKCENR